MRLIIILILFSTVCFGQNKKIVNKSKTINITKTKTDYITRDKKQLIVSQYAGDFYTVNEAINSITDESVSKVYTVNVDTGTWTITQASQYSSTGGYYDHFFTTSYINVIGSGIDKTIFYAELPDTTVLDPSLYSCVDFRGENTISNMQFISKNIRYAAHDDYNSQNTTLTCNNVKFQSLGNLSYYNYWLGLGQTKTIRDISYGCGTSSGRIIDFNNCIFDCRTLFHTNTNFTTRSKLIFDTCQFISRNYNPTGTYTIGANIQSLNSLKDDSAIFNNCTIDSVLYDWYLYQPDTSLLPYNLAEVKIININSNYTFNNRPAYYVSNGSLMFTATDSIRFVSGTTTIFRNSTNLGDSLISKLEVGEWSFCPNTKMAVRLGDCSVVNKVINLVVNGTPQTITFNENYSGKTNAYILGKINLQLTGAIASLYSWASQYQP